MSYFYHLGLICLLNSVIFNDICKLQMYFIKPMWGKTYLPPSFVPKLGKSHKQIMNPHLPHTGALYTGVLSKLKPQI